MPPPRLTNGNLNSPSPLPVGGPYLPDHRYYLRVLMGAGKIDIPTLSNVLPHTYQSCFYNPKLFSLSFVILIAFLFFISTSLSHLYHPLHFVLLSAIIATFTAFCRFTPFFIITSHQHLFPSSSSFPPSPSSLTPSRHL